MSDLDGADAFTLILDRMVEAESRAANNMSMLNDRDATIRDLRRNFDQAVLDRANLDRRAREAKPKLRNLWNAAAAVTQAEVTPEKLEELRKTLALACVECDAEIPF